MAHGARRTALGVGVVAAVQRDIIIML